MFSAIRTRCTPSVALSSLAIIAASTGTAVAAKTVITSTTQIRNGAVTSADIKNGTVGSRDLSRSLRVSLTRAGVQGLAGMSGKSGVAGTSGTSGATGTTGPAGPAGPTGPTGAAGPTGAKGETGLTGAKGETGLTGAKGETGPAGTARAYALVSDDAVALDTSVSKGFLSITRPATGKYCLKVDPASGIDTTTTIPVVGLEYAFSAGSLNHHVLARHNNLPCDADEFAVITVDENGVPANGASFTIMVP